MADYLLRGAVTLLGGIAGVGFAALLPPGLGGQGDLLFYWTVLAGALTLILDGARSPVKLAVGLFALLNATSLLVLALSVTEPGPAVLGLMTLVRVGLAAMLAYGWALLVAVFGELSLEPLFSSRDEVQTRELAPPAVGVLDVAAQGQGAASSAPTLPAPDTQEESSQ